MPNTSELVLKSEIGNGQSEMLPLPVLPIRVREATMADLPFIDRLQKANGKALGFFPRAQMEGYVRNGWMLVAEASGQLVVGSGQSKAEGAIAASSVLPTIHCPPPTPLGYIASCDRYLKRDELGAVFQLCVAPGAQRKLVGATLLKAVFDRAAYGTRLFCCWCAQDLAANRFWEAMGFVPLAFRTGGRGTGVRGSPFAVRGDGPPSDQPRTANRRPRTPSSRVHIFWQRRIRAADTTTPWWYPSETGGGAVRENRLVLPIPPGVRWSDPMPVVLPDDVRSAESGMRREDEPTKALPGLQRKRVNVKADEVPAAKAVTKPAVKLLARPSFGPAEVVPVAPAAPVVPAKQVQPTTQVAQPDCPPPTARRPLPKKNDPALVKRARELRDRWMEQVNASPLVGVAKYELSRAGSPAVLIQSTGLEPAVIDVTPAKLLAA